MADAIPTSDAAGVVVTGAGGGIGSSVCHGLARAGYRIAAWDIDARTADDVAGALPTVSGDHTAAAVDVADAAAVRAATAQLLQRWGDVYGLVHCAGIAQFKDFLDLSAEDWSRMLDTHLTSSLHLLQCLLPPLADRGDGRVVLISSVAAMSGSPDHAHYAAAKAGQLGLAKALSKRFGAAGVTINCVAPGGIDTPLFRASSPGSLDRYADNPMRRIGSVDDVAAAVEYLLSTRSSFVTGHVLNVSGGVYL